MAKLLLASFVAVSLLFAGSVTLAQEPTTNMGSVESATTDALEQNLVTPLRGQPGELTNLLNSQDPGSVFANPVKHAIRSAVDHGVAVDTVVLLLLLPLVAAVIATARHLVGIQGFGILLPAALSVVFVSTGPVVGIALFLVIVIVATIVRMLLRKFKISLQYLPRMAFILWMVVVGVLAAMFSAPFISGLNVADVSIFPVLILILLAEDFTRVQLGKSVRVAVALTTETLILALASFVVLQLRPVQHFALLNPEMLLILVAIFDFFLGKYAGLRLLELWRFRRLIGAR
ncbi:hypothetical protein CMO96_03030 [Candidatus Woesebacteria bacterium]|nr:hypothetical protein [Candidatus Woesebacteria bacterium]